MSKEKTQLYIKDHGSKDIVRSLEVITSYLRSATENEETSVRDIGKYLTMIPLKEGGKSIQSFIKEELGGLMRFLNTFEDRFILSFRLENQRKETYVKLRQEKPAHLVGRESLSSVSYDGQNVAYSQSRSEKFENLHAVLAPRSFLRSSVGTIDGNDTNI